MDDERFYELIRKAEGHAIDAATAKTADDRHRALRRALRTLQLSTDEVRNREITAAVNRENARLAVKGP